jgi:hypothetical protein
VQVPVWRLLLTWFHVGIAEMQEAEDEELLRHAVELWMLGSLTAVIGIADGNASTAIAERVLYRLSDCANDFVDISTGDNAVACDNELNGF